MINSPLFFIKSLAFLIVCSATINALPIIWVAQHPNNDMNNPANWSSNTVPGSNDDAIFDSSFPGISSNPISNSPFSISAFHFISQASNFSFNFNNSALTFNGIGITGNHTNCNLHVTNTDNSGFPGNLISFLGATGHSGSSNIISSNSSTLTGNLSNTGRGGINSNIYSSGPFTIDNGGSLIASNTGNDSTNGTGNNGASNTTSSQLRFDQSFTAGNNVTVSATNSGTFTGTNTVQGNAVAIVNGSQWISSGAFQAGDHFICQIENTGNDSSTGVGLSNVSQLNAAQMIFESTGTVNNNCSITVSNRAVNSSQITNFNDFIGFINDQQFFVGEIFQAGNDFTLTVNNIGTDTSQGNGGALVAVINSNSGFTGNQVLFQQGCTLGDRATWKVSNNGAYSGTNINGGSNVALMNQQQVVVGDFISPGSYAFNTGDNFNLNVSCVGNDSASGRGLDVVGNVSTDQVTFYTPCFIGNQAEITVNKSGEYSGNATTLFVNVGSAGGSQLNCTSTFQASDSFSLSIGNSGTNTGNGNGNNFIGILATGQQARFGNSLTLGDKASITISNSAFDASNTSNSNQTGVLLGYGKQLLIEESFQAGDDLAIIITNSGVDESRGAGGNYTGFINNNTADQTASQLHFDGGVIVGNRASIALSNSGTYQGTNTGGNIVGVLAGQQFCSSTDFQAGNNFRLEAINFGTNQASNQNTVGSVGSGGQVEFRGNCVFGENASIVLLNSGVNQDAMGISNTIGHVGGSQMKMVGNFSAEKNLTIQVGNIASNAGDSSNLVGYINGSQLSFEQSCTLNNGSLISAFNSGTVANSQITFDQGFNIASGKATIQAINEGSLGSFGINIQGSNEGGNAEIALQNSSLNIETTLPSFTIGGLSGNNTSFVQSQPSLVINTDGSTRAEFSGSIQNFSTSNSTLVKTGSGTQTLSGVNTYTGLTTIQEGALIVNGSLAENALINSLGVLKGTGTIGGMVTNNGTIAPGESIGTLTVLNNYVNNKSGIYEIEVNGGGQSDLLDVSGKAILNGGVVAVSSVDGTFKFQQPYTIITADGGVVGTYNAVTSSAFIAPVLTYDENNVYLTLLSALLNAAESCNQFGVARNLDHIIHPNALQSLLISSIANLPLEEAQKALESLSGFQYTNNVWEAEISTRRFLRRLYDPLRPLVNSPVPCDLPCRDWIIWLETGGGCTNLHGKNAHKVHRTGYELTGGIQKGFCRNLTFGLAGSYEYDHAKYRNGRGDCHSTFVAAYGLYRPNGFYGLFDLTYGHSSKSLKRIVEAGHLHDHVHGKPILNNSTFYGEVGFDWEKSCFLIQPFLGLQLGKSSRKRIEERNSSGFALAIDKHDWSTVSSRLGLHFSVSHFCHCIDASLDLAWNQRLSSHKNSTISRFKEFGVSFPVCGNNLDKSGFDYALTVMTNLCEGVKGYIELGGEWWQHANTVDALCGIQLSW